MNDAFIFEKDARPFIRGGNRGKLFQQLVLEKLKIQGLKTETGLNFMPHTKISSKGIINLNMNTKTIKFLKILVKFLMVYASQESITFYSCQ